MEEVVVLDEKQKEEIAKKDLEQDLAQDFDSFNKNFCDLLSNSKESFLKEFKKFFKIAVRKLIYQDQEKFLFQIVNAKLPFITKKEVTTALDRIGIRLKKDIGVFETEDQDHARKQLAILAKPETTFKNYADWKKSVSDTDMDKNTLTYKAMVKVAKQLSNLASNIYISVDVACVLKTEALNIYNSAQKYKS